MRFKIWEVSVTARERRRAKLSKTSRPALEASSLHNLHIQTKGWEIIETSVDRTWKQVVVLATETDTCGSKQQPIHPGKHYVLGLPDSRGP
jgi:hypothetical protein